MLSWKAILGNLKKGVCDESGMKLPPLVIDPLLNESVDPNGGLRVKELDRSVVLNPLPACADRLFSATTRNDFSNTFHSLIVLSVFTSEA